MRSVEESALLINLLLKRSGQKRARISMETLRRLSMRKHIRGAFVEMLKQHLADMGLILMEIDRGGYGLIPSSALDGAPAITAKKYLSEDLARLKRGQLNFDDIREEVGEGAGGDDEVDGYD